MARRENGEGILRKEKYRAKEDNMNTITTNTKALQIADAFEALPEEIQNYLYPVVKAVAEGRATVQDLIAKLEKLENMIA